MFSFARLLSNHMNLTEEGIRIITNATIKENSGVEGVSSTKKKVLDRGKHNDLTLIFPVFHTHKKHWLLFVYSTRHKRMDCFDPTYNGYDERLKIYGRNIYVWAILNDLFKYETTADDITYAWTVQFGAT